MQVRAQKILTPTANCLNIVMIKLLLCVLCTSLSPSIIFVENRYSSFLTLWLIADSNKAINFFAIGAAINIIGLIEWIRGL